MISTVTLISMERYVVNVHAPEPSYLQLASQLRARIHSGEIGPREALPSITYLTGETRLFTAPSVAGHRRPRQRRARVHRAHGHETFASPRKS